MVAGGAACTSTGLCRNWLVRRWISGGMVAEKNSVWRVIGRNLADALDIGNEAHVEHAVGFVDHQDLDAVQHQLATLDMVEQPARRGDQDVGATVDLDILVVERHAADQQRNGQAVVAAEPLEGFMDLRRQLPGGLEDQCPRHAGPARPFSRSDQHRQGEGGSFPRTGLGEAQDIPALQGWWNGFGLDGGRNLEAGSPNGFKNFFG